MSDYDGGFGGSQRQHMTDSGASIIEKLDNADLRSALHTKSELIINLRLDIQNCEAKRAGAIDSLREHIEICNELKKDAERYRWLRERHENTIMDIYNSIPAMKPELLDAAVDAAMKECGK